MTKAKTKAKRKTKTKVKAKRKATPKRRTALSKAKAAAKKRKATTIQQGADYTYNIPIEASSQNPSFPGYTVVDPKGDKAIRARVKVEFQYEDENGNVVNPKTTAGSHKVDMSLIPPSALVLCAAAMKEGADKYGAYNWRETGVPASVYVAAMYRHLLQYASGYDIDPDSDTPHLAHIMANCAILLDAASGGNLHDDRNKDTGELSTILDKANSSLKAKEERKSDSEEQNEQ